MLPKRFPDRDEIAAVRDVAPTQLEPGATDESKTFRLAGRVMARREMGKITFLDLVDRSGRIQLLAPARSTSTSATSSACSGHPGEVAPGRAVARRSPSFELLAKNRAPLPDTFHGLTDVELRYRKRYLDLLMNEETRADFLAAQPHRRGDPAPPRRRRLRRGRDAGAAAALRRRLRGAVRHALELPRAGLLPPDRDRALPEAADRRRARARLRDRQGLPQRGHLVQALERVHDARVVRGVRGLPRHDGADGAPASRRSRSR